MKHISNKSEEIKSKNDENSKNMIIDENHTFKNIQYIIMYVKEKKKKQ